MDTDKILKYLRSQNPSHFIWYEEVGGWPDAAGNDQCYETEADCELQAARKGYTRSDISIWQVSDAITYFETNY